MGLICARARKGRGIMAVRLRAPVVRQTSTTKAFVRGTGVIPGRCIRQAWRTTWMNKVASMPKSNAAQFVYTPRFYITHTPYTPTHPNDAPKTTMLPPHAQDIFLPPYYFDAGIPKKYSNAVIKHVKPKRETFPTRLFQNATQAQTTVS